MTNPVAPLKGRFPIARYWKPLTLERRCQLAGWIVFIMCSLLFMVSSFLNRDTWGFAAAAIFLLGCVLFLAPFLLLRR